MRPWYSGWVGTSSGRLESTSRETLPPIPARTTRSRRTERRRGVETMARTLLPPEVTKHNRVTQLSLGEALFVNRVSTSSVVSGPNEGTSLLSRRAVVDIGNQRSYGAVPVYSPTRLSKWTQQSFQGKLCFWLFLLTIIAHLLLIVCYVLVFTIPMAKLNRALIKHLIQHPTSIRFCSATAIVCVSVPVGTEGNASQRTSAFTFKSTRSSAGQLAPSGSPTSTVLLAPTKRLGGNTTNTRSEGVNILFINLIPIVFPVILDGMHLLPWVEGREATGKPVSAFIAFLASRALIFLCLASVISLSYFIGMAVASISAQSSIGMNTVINATFGSIIETILYAIALKEGKGRLVEGSIIGSLLAGVLLMPGMSMCGGAVRRKEQKFNAKSAGVTSTMALIGVLAPTLFYQTHGTVSSSFLLFTAVLMAYVRVIALGISLVPTRDTGRPPHTPKGSLGSANNVTTHSPDLCTTRSTNRPSSFLSYSGLPSSFLCVLLLVIISRHLLFTRS
jgi:hypothetical protein